MKKRIAGLLLVVVSLGMIFSACSKTADIKVGSRVAATFGSSWYLATVSAVKDGEYDVNYDDRTTGTVKKDGIKLINVDQKFKAGDKVLASWNNGAQLYLGVIENVMEDGAVVKWDDGSSPSKVLKGKILQQ